MIRCLDVEAIFNRHLKLILHGSVGVQTTPLGVRTPSPSTDAVRSSHCRRSILSAGDATRAPVLPPSERGLRIRRVDTLRKFLLSFVGCYLGPRSSVNVSTMSERLVAL